jgi:Icc-related predicted phosphoesterase
MRVLAFSDIHGNHRIYRRIVACTAEYKADVVVLAGDLLGVPEGYASVWEAQRADAGELSGILSRIECPVLYVMGNDDMIELDPAIPGCHSLHGRRLEYGPCNFVGYQYSLPFMGGVFEKPEEEIAADMEQIRPRLDGGTVLVTHNPAYGVLDVGVLGEHAGSPAILAAVRERAVRVHIHGHIHDYFGYQGPHFNVSSGGRIMRGMVIDLETLEHRVIDEGPLPPIRA